jgi:uncharacterized membrane protein YgdD (TMEM256/DUF423 family)
VNEVNITAKLFLILGSANAMLAVILGAFGAHALKARLDESLLKVYHTGVEYHFYHALGLILIGIIALNIPVNIWLKNAGWMMLAGIFLFSGSLYLLSLLNMRWLGMITPIGGLLFILSWLSLCIFILKTK